MNPWIVPLIRKIVLFDGMAMVIYQVFLVHGLTANPWRPSYLCSSTDYWRRITSGPFMASITLDAGRPFSSNCVMA